MVIIPRGIRNNNPLNIRKGCNWLGEKAVQTDPVFEQFVSIEYGIRAGLKLIRNYILGKNATGRKLDTVDAICRRWAPPVENDTEHYIRCVAAMAELHRFEKIDPNSRHQMCKLFQSMAWMENGEKIPIEKIQAGFDLL